MSYGSSIPRSSSQAADEPVQRQLQSLLQHLNWSYAALRSFNHQSRSLAWTGGHFRGNALAETEVWNEHLFNSMYKTCTFTLGQGFVGTAYAESRNIWLNGALVHSFAGSKEQAQFLQHARIESGISHNLCGAQSFPMTPNQCFILTVVCIPLAERVLELGTSESVAEDVHLLANICCFMRQNILPALEHAGVSQAPLNVSPSPLAAISMMQSSPIPLLKGPVRHQSDEFLSQDFDPNSLNEQIRRTSSLDMSLQQPEAGEGEVELDAGIVPEEPRWRSPATSRLADILLTQKPPLLATNQALMSARFQTYRSHSSSIGTTSSSLSSLEDSCARLSVDSPEQNISLMAFSQPRLSSHSYASSSARRDTPSHSPELQPGDTNTTTTRGMAAPQHLHGIQQAFGHMLQGGEPLNTQPEQWPHMYIETGINLLEYSGAMQNIQNVPLSEPQLRQALASSSLQQDQRQGFQAWRRTHVLAPAVLQRREGSTNHLLLRRCLELLRRIPNSQRRTQIHGAAVQGPLLTSSSSPETTLAEHDPSNQAGPSRGGKRIRGVSRIGTTAPVNAEQEEAAKLHMISERHRRMRQKENFTALRRLVPIISKNDKASILGDAIIYIKDLQERIQELEASRTQIEGQYESLKLSHQELEEQNKQLKEAMAAGSRGAGPVLPP